MTEYVAAYLLGRCANGAERDKGKLVHAVPTESFKAMCGATYGNRSAGWQYPEVHGEPPTITCPRCLSKIKKAGETAKRRAAIGQAFAEYF